MIRDHTFQMSSEIHLFLELTCYQSAVNGWGLQVHFNDFWSKDFFHHNFAFTKNHRRHLCFPSLHPRPDNHAGFERLYAPIFFEKTDFGFLEIHVPEMMHVKYVLVGYLSMHVLCCLFSFKKNTRPFSSVSTNKETRRTTIRQTRRAHFLLGHFSLWLSLWFLLSTKVRGFLRILRPAKQDMLMPSLSWLEVTCYPGFFKTVQLA